ncbi:MAG: HYR domain-containing protein [Phycisphaerales bacterium]|nr:MAG: HYR domain-containing protein [Phycisphaerales bacterium]
MKRKDVLAVGITLTFFSGVAWAGGRPPLVAPFGSEGLMVDYSSGVAEQGGRDGYGPGVQAAADWIIADRCADNGWSWPTGANCPATYHNITAPIAIGLLKAYSITGDLDTLNAAIDGGDFDLTGVWADSGDTAFGSFTPAFFYILSDVTADSTYSDNAAEDFFDKLTAGTYGDPASDPVYYPADTYGYLDRHKAIRSGYSINLRPWDMLYMPWVAGLIGNDDSTDPPDGVSQQETFLQAVLDGLNTLDDTDPYNVYWDLTGLAGGVLGLALNGTTSFPAIVAPKHAINGIDNLTDLADALAAYQNANGSWNWASNLSSPDASDEDTQNTAYAVLALIAAEDVIPAPGGRYNAQITKARAWLDSMQDTDGSYFSYPGGGKNTEVCGEALHAAAVNTLSLNTSVCSTDGTLDVTIDMAAMPVEIAGGMFFLEYNTAVLDFVDIAPGDYPFDTELDFYHDGGLGTIRYSVGDPFGGGHTAEARRMATISFTFDATVCEALDSVTFDRDHTPPTMLSDLNGLPVMPTLMDVGPVTYDTTPPVIHDCPSNIEVNADAGGCDAVVTWTPPYADDNCALASFVSSHDPGDTFSQGTTTVTYTATDICGWEDTCSFDVTVSGYNELVMDIELQSIGIVSLSRCITFELTGTDTDTWAEVITFTSGYADDVVIEVPCGDYDCLLVSDHLHTLKRKADDFTIVGTQYVATVTDPDYLLGGNLNGDLYGGYIDILDFGIFVGEWGEDYGTGDTNCSTPYPHADISGNGTVGTEDFTFIQINYLEENEGCAKGLHPTGTPQADSGLGPVTRISVAELVRLGMADLIVADLNGDGWLDENDIVAFLDGARPGQKGR